jgi:hypothetical protein
MRTHDLQSDESHAQRLPRLQPPAAGIRQSSGPDSLAPLWRYRPPDLRLTTCSPNLITDVRRPSSIRAIDMLREVLGVRLRQQRRYQLLSIQEWLFQGFLKRIRIGDDVTYNLEFKLPSISEHLHLPISPAALDICSSKEVPAKVPIHHDIAAHSKTRQAPLQPKKRRVK